MIPARNLLTIGTLATVVLLLAACSRGDDRPPQEGDVAVARVMDQTIWASDVRREAVAQGLVGEDEPLEASSDLFGRVLDEVIDQKLLAREAERRGLDNSALAQRRLEATRERILGDLLVESVVDQTLSDDAVQTLYREQLRLARASEEIRTRVIVTRTRPEAEAVLGILGQGAAFEAVASERSVDEATRFSGGDLGYSTPDVMPRAYADAVRAAQPGTTVGPIQTEDGWAVLRVEDRRTETPPTLDQARPQIVRYLTYESVRQLLEQLRGRADVEVMLNSDAVAAPATPAPAPQTPTPAPKAAAASPAKAAA